MDRAHKEVVSNAVVAINVTANALAKIVIGTQILKRADPS